MADTPKPFFPSPEARRFFFLILALTLLAWGAAAIQIFLASEASPASAIAYADTLTVAKIGLFLFAAVSAISRQFKMALLHLGLAVATMAFKFVADAIVNSRLPVP